ncbi:MAG: hypothetical protein ABIH39_03930 [Candidatus Margulisiibacteriota bacterium]
MNLSACKEDIVNAISNSCLRWSAIGGYYVKSDIQVFADVPIDKVWGNSLDPNSSDPIVQKKLVIKEALEKFALYRNAYNDDHQTSDYNESNKWWNNYKTACGDLVKETIKANLTRNSNKEWAQASGFPDIPTNNSTDPNSTTDCIQIMKRYLPGYCSTLNTSEQKQINTIQARTINGYYNKSYSNNSDIKNLWDGLGTGSVADNLITNCISRDGADNGYGFTTWSQGSRLAANLPDGVPVNNISTYLGNYSDRLNTIESNMIIDKEAEIRGRDLQFYLDKPNDYPDIKAAWDWLQGHKLKLDSNSIVSNGTDWVLQAGQVSGKIGTLLNEIIAEMNRLDGTNPPAASWQDARYKTNYIISRWEQIDTFNTVQAEYIDTTGVFPSGVVEGGINSDHAKFKYKIDATGHSLGWEVYSKTSSGFRKPGGSPWDGYDSRLVQAYQQTRGLTMSQVRGTQAADGDPYNTNWAVHAMGTLSRLLEKSIGMNVAVRAGNRARSEKYKQEMKKYREEVDEEIYDEGISESKAAKNKSEQKGALKKAENENNAARKKEWNKAIQRIKESNKKQEAESKKAANKSAASNKKKK